MNVVGANGCAWTASSNADWIVLSGSASGNGNGTVGFYVASNSGFADRYGTITIAGRSFYVSQKRTVDQLPPQIFITSQHQNGILRTANLSISIQGTASDDIAVKQVTWRTERGRSGIANGTSNWSVNDIAVSRGANPITVTATDTKGNSSSTTITVISAAISEHLIYTYAGTGGQGFSGDGGQASAATLNMPTGIAVDSKGNVYVADSQNHRIRKITKAGLMETFAGTGMAGFSGDGGAAATAQLSGPTAIVVDKDDNIYIADTDNRRVRKVLATTGVITTFAGNGQLVQTTIGTTNGDGGLAINARVAPTRITTDSEGNLYLTGEKLAKVRKINIRTGVISTIAGTAGTGFGGDGGPATSAYLYDPTDVCVDSANNLYIADSFNYRIRKVDTNGIITTVAGKGGLPMSDPEGELATNVGIAPSRVKVDQQGNIYFIEGYIVRKIPVSTGRIITLTGGFGGGVGEGLAARDAFLNLPRDIVVNNDGSIFIADTLSHKIRLLALLSQLDIQKPAITIAFPTYASSYAQNSKTLNVSGTATSTVPLTSVTWRNSRDGKSGSLATGLYSWTANNIPLLLGENDITITAWDALGNSGSKILNVLYAPSNTINYLAGNQAFGSNLESGTALSSQLYLPKTVALDGAGNLYIADTGNHRIRKVTRTGQISTVAGNGQLGSGGDGGLAINATLNQPNGIAVDNSGNLYISDTNNHRIRKVNAAGVITTIAGTGIGGFAGDGGLATQAQCNTPVGITLDHAGNLLIADAGNHRIRKVNLGSGLITTIAGNGYGSGGDGGQATAAQLNFPTGVALDQAGSLYISDTLNQQVRKVSATGIITRFAGSGTAGFSGDAGPAVAAQFSAPGGLTVDAAGNVYIADQGNHRVRKVAADGTITTVAGNGTTTSQPNDEGGAATNAALNAPAGVAVDAAGNLFIADTNNHRVVVVAAYQRAATVNAASYANTQPVAAESLVSVFGANLATRDQVVTQLPLPTELAGTSVKVRDSLGVERLASLFYVGKLQVNYQIPAGTAAGYAIVTITNGNGEIFTSAVNITNVTPGLFTANQNGSGPAAASVLFVRNGVFRYESNFACDAQGQNCTARQIDLNAGDEVFLELYGTGLRNNSGLSNVLATVGGVTVPVLYANKQPDFIGLDQVNIALPKTLLGRGEVDVVLTVDGKVANPVKILLK